MRIRLWTVATLAMLAAPAVSLAQDAKTSRVWRAKCASCHGPDGKGATEQGQKTGVADMTAAAWQKEVTDERIKKALAEGIKREQAGKKQEMEAYKDLAPDQVAGLIKLIRTFAK